MGPPPHLCRCGDLASMNSIERHRVIQQFDSWKPQLLAFSDWSSNAAECKRMSAVKSQRLYRGMLAYPFQPLAVGVGWVVWLHCGSEFCPPLSLCPHEVISTVVEFFFGVNSCLACLVGKQGLFGAWPERYGHPAGRLRSCVFDQHAWWKDSCTN